MQSNHSSPQRHAHEHPHVHDHQHGHEHSHPASAVKERDERDLKSPVLIGVAQRLVWLLMLLAVLWLSVYWALRTNG
jgi:ABC-type nickel/cobalt efflux system permease component RcnA